jgi:carboxypeptidase C (cathepsin A)
MKKAIALSLAFVFISVVYFPAWSAQERPAPSPPQKIAEAAKPSGPVKPVVDPDLTAVTKHSVTIGGKPLAYSATCGMLPIIENGKTMAHIFYIAYIKDGVADKSGRPILFSFNGGPGSSSVWMHLGFTGPRRVAYGEEGWLPKPPYGLTDNEFSVLDEADIVYIDPVGTGYSRMMPGEDAHKYHGVMEDIQSVGEFIRLYLSRNDRWASPKFVIGESYGTTRAAGLTGYLSQLGISLNGTILVSTMTLGVQTGDDLSYVTILPHYTATAWFHKKLPADLQAKPLRDVLDESEKFAVGEYTLALVRGNGLTAEEKDAVARKLARLTGLAVDYLKESNLRVSRPSFRKELLRAEGFSVGRLDSRYKGVQTGVAGETFESDPAMSAWMGPFTTMANAYFKEELKYSTDLVYHIFGDVRPWKGLQTTGMTTTSVPFVAGVGDLLRQALAANSFLRVLVLEGYYDAACDYFSALYAFSHLDPAGFAKDRVKFAFYECGHMMYIRRPDLAQAKKDLAEFIRAAAAK